MHSKLEGAVLGHKWCLILVLTTICLTRSALGAEANVTNAAPWEPPTIPVGLDAYRMWERWPNQRIGCRAYMRSTYDRRGGNETADASHFLYQLAEDFNVSLDVEGTGVLYFVRTNHWHGSPWHYEIDGTDHIVQETTTADPTRKLDHSVFLPERLFPNPLTWTYSITKGADLMWVPMPFEQRFRLAYSRTFYGTGYYIYHLYAKGANLSQAVRAWDGKTPPAEEVLELLRAAGTDIAPKQDSPRGRELGVRELSGSLDLRAGQRVAVTTLGDGPSTLRALQLSVPRKQATVFGRGRLRVTWDGRSDASIDAPIALFFGTGTLHNRDGNEHLVKALPVNVRFDDDRVQLACYFPMPFFRSASIELVGPKDEAIADIQWAVRTQPLVDPPSHVGYFHATYRNHPDPVPGKDNLFLDTQDVEGGGDWSGNFVGTSFIFSDRAILNTLEGDPRFFFDDSLTPQAYGTGTEEWGGGGDYWGGRTMSLPLAGHPVGVRKAEDARSEEELIQSAYRFLLADLMPFGKRAVIRLEHGGTNQSTEHYQSVTYWYGLPSASLVLTDELDIGSAESEKQHRYVSPDASEPYELTSRYEWGIDRMTIGSSAESRVLPRPRDYAEFEFEAEADKTYYIWVRGKSAGGIQTDATWFQFDEQIGTDQLGPTYGSAKGFGNWRDAARPKAWSWSSSLPQLPPQSVRFRKHGPHRLRIQRRHAPHVIDQIWLSASQATRPDSADPITTPAGGSLDEILLDVTKANALQGGFRVVDDPTSSAGKALLVSGGGPASSDTREIYPAHTEVGRTTTSQSEFVLNLRPDNYGVVLRRPLDYQFPHQRAEVYVAAADSTPPQWKYAGAWYLAGSNTCYHSYPRKEGELGKSKPVVQTSNRRFRDDEFLLSRELTEGRDAIRVRVKFTPVRIPLLPGREVDELAWSEIRYKAYCYVKPEFDLD